MMATSTSFSKYEHEMDRDVPEDARPMAMDSELPGQAEESATADKAVPRVTGGLLSRTISGQRLRPTFGARPVVPALCIPRNFHGEPGQLTSLDFFKKILVARQHLVISALCEVAHDFKSGRQPAEDFLMFLSDVGFFVHSLNFMDVKCNFCVEKPNVRVVSRHVRRQTFPVCLCCLDGTVRAYTAGALDTIERFGELHEMCPVPEPARSRCRVMNASDLVVADRDGTTEPGECFYLFDRFVFIHCTDTMGGCCVCEKSTCYTADLHACKQHTPPLLQSLCPSCAHRQIGFRT